MGPLGPTATGAISDFIDRNMILILQDQKMVIEAILFLAFVILVGAIIVKIYEWRQDVLYGRYVGRRSERNRH